MVNEGYEPDDDQERIVELLKEGRDAGRPWGRVTPALVSERAGMRRQEAHNALRALAHAGWVRQVAHATYELVEDPRERGQGGPAEE